MKRPLPTSPTLPGLPFVVDLGSGTLTDFAAYGLPAEPTPQQALAAGADIVTFSGDKLLGGPQAGLIVGRKDLVARIKKNPLKRALRVGKTTLAALEATLRLYRDPDRLSRAPAYPAPAHPAAGRHRSHRPTPAAAHPGSPWRNRCRSVWRLAAARSAVAPCRSNACPRLALLCRPTAKKPGKALLALEAAFRGLPVPVIGHIRDDAYHLDLRCLEARDEARFVAAAGAPQVLKAASPGGLRTACCSRPARHGHL